MAHEFKPGDTFSVSTWGRLPKQELAQNGLDVLMGMLSAYHANCRWPTHFWCAPPEETVSAVAEIYQADNPQGEHYIGCFLRGDFDQPPSLKLVMQPLSNGRVFVQFGAVSPSGLLTQEAAERFTVAPRHVPDVPEDLGERITFVLRRDKVWHIARLEGDAAAPAYVRIIAQLPILPDPTPLEIFDIKGLAPQ